MAVHVTCFPFMVELNNPVDYCNISESSPLALSDHLGISPFVCAQQGDSRCMSVVMPGRGQQYIASISAKAIRGTCSKEVNVQHDNGTQRGRWAADETPLVAEGFRTADGQAGERGLVKVVRS